MKSQGFDRVRFDRCQEKLIFSSASMKYLPLPHPSPSPPAQKREITVPASRAQQEQKIYEWRSRTEFPVPRVLHFSLRTHNLENSVFEVEVESFPTRLSELRNVSLFKMLYLIKEALIGFERLFQTYGPFLPSPRMVAINAANKCKVWLSDNFAANTCRPCCLDEKAFLAALFRVFEMRANAMRNTRSFFQQLGHCKTFCAALAFLEDYARTNKITIVTSCRLAENEIVRELEPKTFQGTRTMNEPPKSLSTIPLRTSFDHESKNPLLEVVPSYNKRLNGEEHEASVKLKKSEETAAEAFEKKSSGLEAEDQFFLESNLLKNDVETEQLARSQLQPKLHKLNFIRKFSDQYAGLSPTKSKPSLASPAKQHPNLPRSRWNENSFINCEFEENFTNVFSQNKWEKTLQGLFMTQNEELKKSFHEGKEQRRVEDKFAYLDKFGKTIQESFIHEEDTNQI